MALAIGFGLVVLFGLFHHLALTWFAHRIPERLRQARMTAVLVFTELAALHVAEIAAFAVAYAWLDGWIIADGFGGTFEGTWRDYLYFSAINFVTLGYTDIDVLNEMRMVSMLQSLCGFMLLTWSATFLYSVCQSDWNAD